LSAAIKIGYLATPTMRERSRSRMTAAKRIRKTTRVCIGGGSNDTMGKNPRVVSVREADRRTAARRVTGRKKSTTGKNMCDML